MSQKGLKLNKTELRLLSEGAGHVKDILVGAPFLADAAVWGAGLALTLQPFRPGIMMGSGLMTMASYDAMSRHVDGWLEPALMATLGLKGGLDIAYEAGRIKNGSWWTTDDYPGMFANILPKAYIKEEKYTAIPQDQYWSDPAKYADWYI